MRLIWTQAGQTYPQPTHPHEHAPLQPTMYHNGAKLQPPAKMSMAEPVMKTPPATRRFTIGYHIDSKGLEQLVNRDSRLMETAWPPPLDNVSTVFAQPVVMRDYLPPLNVRVRSDGYSEVTDRVVSVLPGTYEYVGLPMSHPDAPAGDDLGDAFAFGHAVMGDEYLESIDSAASSPSATLVSEWKATLQAEAGGDNTIRRQDVGSLKINDNKNRSNAMAGMDTAIRRHMSLGMIEGHVVCTSQQPQQDQQRPQARRATRVMPVSDAEEETSSDEEEEEHLYDRGNMGNQPSRPASCSELALLQRLQEAWESGMAYSLRPSPSNSRAVSAYFTADGPALMRPDGTVVMLESTTSGCILNNSEATIMETQQACAAECPTVRPHSVNMPGGEACLQRPSIIYEAATRARRDGAETNGLDEVALDVAQQLTAMVVLSASCQSLEDDVFGDAPIFPADSALPVDPTTPANAIAIDTTDRDPAAGDTDISCTPQADEKTEEHASDRQGTTIGTGEVPTAVMGNTLMSPGDAVVEIMQ